MNYFYVIVILARSTNLKIKRRTFMQQTHTLKHTDFHVIGILADQQILKLRERLSCNWTLSSVSVILTYC